MAAVTRLLVLLSALLLLLGGVAAAPSSSPSTSSPPTSSPGHQEAEEGQEEDAQLTLSILPGVDLRLTASGDSLFLRLLLRPDNVTNSGDAARKKSGFFGSMPFMMLGPMISYGMFPFMFANLNMLVMKAVMLNNMVLNMALFNLIRNVVFGPKPGRKVIYKNYGYRKPQPPVHKFHHRPPEVIHVTSHEGPSDYGDAHVSPHILPPEFRGHDDQQFQGPIVGDHGRDHSFRQDLAPSSGPGHLQKNFIGEVEPPRPGIPVSFTDSQSGEPYFSQTQAPSSQKFFFGEEDSSSSLKSSIPVSFDDSAGETFFIQSQSPPLHKFSMEENQANTGLGSVRTASFYDGKGRESQFFGREGDLPGSVTSSTPVAFSNYQSGETFFKQTSDSSLGSISPQTFFGEEDVPPSVQGTRTHFSFSDRTSSKESARYPWTAARPEEQRD